MAPELSRFVQRMTFLLLALSATATEIAADDMRSVQASLGLAAIWIGLTAASSYFLPRPKESTQTPPRFVLLVLLVLAVIPFVVESLRRSYTQDGHSFELRMVLALRNLGLGLAACSAWLLCLRLACVVSLFLMLFSAAMTNHPVVLTILGLYTAVGSAWLMLVYWAGLERSFITSEYAVSLEVRPGRERLPWLTILVIVALVSSVPGLIAVGPQEAARTLGELFPTSGGTGDYDPFARGGVNDGDNEVKGDNAKSTGMTPSESFLNSPLPSLYDMLNDMYGEPFKPKERERAIALDAQTKVQESSKPPADNLRPNREFPTARKSPRHPREASSRAARALFEVQGRTPLHVRVTTFDAFDGMSWQEAPLNQNIGRVEKESKSNWMEVMEQTPSPIFTLPESHQFKITSSLGTLVPTPPHLTRFRVGRVDRPDFFGWGQDRILRMTQRKTPSGIVVETECRTVDPRRLELVQFSRGVQGERFQYATLPPALDSEVAALARAWADGLAPGGLQIAAVVEHMRTEYILDSMARVPEDCRDPLGYFLLQSHRGPDYQFASAAAILLRVLGYQTRLVNGFYVAPDHYDPVTRHTPVGAEDLHFWTEVMLPSGDWLVVEPSPGYAVLEPHLPLSERFLAMLMDVASLVRQHAIALSLVSFVLAAVWWCRQELLDAGSVWLLHRFPGRNWKQHVRRVVWLLERRGALAGQRRQLNQTIRVWLYPVHDLPGVGSGAELGRLTQIAEWAAYAPSLSPPWGEDEIKCICRRVLDGLTLRQWRNAVSSHTARGARL